MTCRACGAALADDQRYCLNCGQRQAEPRVDFQRHLDQATATKGPSSAENGRGEAAAVAPPGPPPEKRQRDYAPLAAAGGIAVLGIMLLIGVLIGRGTGSDQASAPPQVVTVAQDANEGGGAEAKEPADAAGKGKGGKKDAKRKNAAASGSTDTGNAPVASQGQLEDLQGKTGQEYAEESAKLPDEIATEGEPPPTDNKAPGGGSGGTTIE